MYVCREAEAASTNSIQHRRTVASVFFPSSSLPASSVPSARAAAAASRFAIHLGSARGALEVTTVSESTGKSVGGMAMARQVSQSVNQPMNQVASGWPTTRVDPIAEK
jgi:hypothetical protein